MYTQSYLGHNEPAIPRVFLWHSSSRLFPHRLQLLAPVAPWSIEIHKHNLMRMVLAIEGVCGQHLCVYVCVCMYVCVFVCVCVFMYVEWASMISWEWCSRSKCQWSEPVCVCVYVCMCIHTYVYTHVHTYIHVPGQWQGHHASPLWSVQVASSSPRICWAVGGLCQGGSWWPVCVYVCLYVCQTLSRRISVTCMCVCMFVCHECV